MGKDEDPKIRKSNALVDAIYNPGSLRRMKLLLTAIAQVDGPITQNTEIEVSAAGMADLLGEAHRGGSFYKELERAASELMGMRITIYEHPDGSMRRKDRTEINVVDRCQYVESEGRVSLQFTRSIIPYISGLQERYKEFRLAQVMNMKSTHGIRLYELALRWEYPNGEKKLTVEEFKRMMGIKNRYKGRIDRMKAQVIDPAVRDVNEHSDRTITVGQVKSGRTITHLQFRIAKKVNMKSLTKGPRVGYGKDFQKYADAVLPVSPLGKQYTNRKAAEVALRVELDEGTIRDMTTGRIIQRRGEPVT